MKKAVLYARVSSEGGRQDTERQIIDLTDYALQHNMEVINRFEDYMSGAKPNKDRVYLQQCLQFCTDAENHVDVLLMTEVSRLGRDEWEMLELAKYFHDHHINVYFMRENFSLYNPDGSENNIFPLIFSLHSIFASQERENIKTRLKSGYDKYRRKGGKVGRKPGDKKSREQLEEQYKHVLKELRHGTSVVKTAKLCDVSASTVARLKKTFGINYTPKKNPL